MRAGGTLAALFVLAIAGPADASLCPRRPSFVHIPTLRAHVGFPVDYQPFLKRFCGTLQFGVVAGAPGFTVDQAGGRFYWTPVITGTYRVTIRVTQNNAGIVAYKDKSFRAIVDDNTLTYPFFRDYLSQPTTVAITGRTHLPYRLSYADQAAPSVRFPIVGPGAPPVETTGLLASWDISHLPDGGRYLLVLSAGHTDLVDPVIIDRSAKPGWPKRVAAITHSVAVADLDDDGVDEVMVVTHSGELYAWRIDGTELFETEGLGPGYSGPAVGDVDGDGRPEIVWATEWQIWAHRSDGTLVPGFPTPFDPTKSFREPPTLADLDGDGVLDVVAVSTDGTVATVYAWGCTGGGLTLLPGWPRTLDEPYRGSSASVCDLDGDGLPEVIVAGRDRVYAWHADGTPVTTGLHGAALPVPIAGAETNAGTTSAATAQPAIADLDGDGTLEVVVGANVLRPDGTPAPGWEGGRPAARNTASAAIGDLDGDPANGLEVVVAGDAWHADGTAVPGWPIAGAITTAVLGDLGENRPAAVAGTRRTSAPPTPGVDAYHADGTEVAAFPKSLYGFTGDISAPVIGDFDGDGIVDVATAITDASYGGVVAVWNVWTANRDEAHPWRMLGHDVRHTGFWTPTPPNRPTDLVASGPHLAWQDRSAVEDRYVVERSATGTPWTWTAVATLPADSVAWDDPEPGTWHYRVRAERVDPRTGRYVSSPPSPGT